jgi:hypothetical protein
MLIDKGSTSGVVAGQRLTVYRDPFGAEGPVTELGGGIVLEPMPQVSMIRIDWSRDGLRMGDRIALHPIN